LTASQKTIYGDYLAKRSLEMKPEDFKELIQLNNELFKDTLNLESLVNQNGMIHKIQRIELKIDKVYGNNGTNNY
tara:strand:+ start:1584 stop:1808 length:225 start_codon:yes stop_codon:yes gene_type:complete